MAMDFRILKTNKKSNIAACSQVQKELYFLNSYAHSRKIKIKFPFNTTLRTNPDKISDVIFFNTPLKNTAGFKLIKILRFLSRNREISLSQSTIHPRKVNTIENTLILSHLPHFITSLTATISKQQHGRMVGEKESNIDRCS